MNSLYITIVIIVATVVTFTEWRKSDGKVTIVRAILGWLFTIAVMLVAIYLVNLLVDIFRE